MGLLFAGLRAELDINRLTIVCITLMGYLHLTIYALLMPPWGLLDEPAHYHYIQVIATEHRLPVMWQDVLSDEILDSMYKTQRWQTHGWPTPPPDQVLHLLEDQSYQAHHPPLYYAVLALIFPVGPTSVLDKLFFLRIIQILFSSLTIVIVWQSTHLLWPNSPWIAIVAALFVVLHPERAASVSQLNNDVLLEPLCALAFSLLAIALVNGINWRLALMMGLVLGLAVLTKLSALIIVPIIILGWIIAAIIQQQPLRMLIGQIIVILISVSGCLLPIVARNFILYRELTGLGAFVAQAGSQVTGSVTELTITGFVDILRHSWVVLWDGAKPVSKPSAALMQIALIGETSLLAVVLGRAWVRQDRRLTPLIKSVIVIGCAALALVSLSVLLGYVRGFVPVVQGRFLLPAIVPTAWLIGFSLWLVGVQWRGLMATLLFLLEMALGMSTLFFHALPKFYAPRHTGFLGYWPQTVYLFSPAGLFWDKPGFVQPWTVGLTLLAFCGCTIVVGILWMKQFGSPLHLDQLRMVMNFVKAQTFPPSLPQAHSPIGLKTSWGTRLHQAVRAPLFWATAILLLIYMGWVSIYPSNIFWSLDEGGKYIHLQSIIASGDPGTPLLYPGRYLDQNLQFVPLYFWSLQNDQVYSWWPVGFQLITMPFYLLFGWFGLYLLPALAGAVSALFAGLLVRHLQPQSPWLTVLAVIITGLATPVAFYSTLFWEHTLSVACFLGGILLILHAWKTGSSRWIIAAGISLALATYLRTDTATMIVGIGLVLLVFYWRWFILLGASYIFTCLFWLLSNWLLMGHLLARYWLPGDVSMGTSPLFRGFYEAGIWFIPYALFNSPRIAAFQLDAATLTLATLITVLALAAPFLGRFKGLSLVAYLGLAAVCGWVLFKPDGYRSIHGFVLIAPQIVFAAWLYYSPSVWRKSPLPALLLGLSLSYALAYVAKAWVAAGGLQWGPRYMLAFYPLLVAASVAGLAAAWPSLRRPMRLSLLALFALCVLLGLGYQVRGAYAALETKRYYQQTEQTIHQLHTEKIVTSCPWLGMVMPDLYLNGSVFTINSKATFEEWVAEARRVGVRSVCRVEMDLCQLTLLDEIARQRATNPGGIEVQCFAE